MDKKEVIKMLYKMKQKTEDLNIEIALAIKEVYKQDEEG